MEASSTDPPEFPVISYPDLASWSAAYSITPERGIKAIRHLSDVAFGNRPGLLDREQRRYYLDMHRFNNVLEQLCVLQERDVFTLSFRCPSRMMRYQDALTATIARGVTYGASMDAVRDAEQVGKVLSRFVEEVTTFYQGLS